MFCCQFTPFIFQWWWRTDLLIIVRKESKLKSIWNKTKTMILLEIDDEDELKEFENESKIIDDEKPSFFSIDRTRNKIKWEWQWQTKIRRYKDTKTRRHEEKKDQSRLLSSRLFFLPLPYFNSICPFRTSWKAFSPIGFWLDFEWHLVFFFREKMFWLVNKSMNWSIWKKWKREKENWNEFIYSIKDKWLINIYWLNKV